MGLHERPLTYMSSVFSSRVPSQRRNPLSSAFCIQFQCHRRHDPECIFTVSQEASLPPSLPPSLSILGGRNKARMDEDKQATERQIEMPRTWEQKSVVRVSGRTGAGGREAPLPPCSQVPAAVNVLTVAIKGALCVPRFNRLN